MKNVIIGRNQNPWKECHIQAMENDGIQLVRRTTGGGTVYQDIGNMNFSFISPLSSYDNKRNSSIILKALKSFDIKAETSGRNDILVTGLKVSGSAYKISEPVALHHGTLLINTDLNSLEKYLNPNKLKLQSKGIESVKSSVVNLSSFNPNIIYDNMFKKIVTIFGETYNSKPEITLPNFNAVEYFELEKYQSSLENWKWIYGETLKFNHNIETKFDWGMIDLHFTSDDGIITDVKIYSDCLYPEFITIVEKCLTGKEYNYFGIDLSFWWMESILKTMPELKETIKFLSPLKKWILKSL